MNTTSLYDFIMYNRLMFDDIMITKKSYTVSSNFIITPLNYYNLLDFTISKLLQFHNISL